MRYIQKLHRPFATTSKAKQYEIPIRNHVKTVCKSHKSRRIKNFTPVPITIGITVVNEDVKFLIQR